jgi:hypothetical protein
MLLRGLSCVCLITALNQAMGQSVLPMWTAKRDSFYIDGAREKLAATSTLLTDSSGRLYVIRSQSVRVFDSTGRALHTIGRPGIRLGEFQQISTVGSVADSVWLFDRSLNRLTFVGADGRITSSRPGLPAGNVVLTAVEQQVGAVSGSLGMIDRIVGVARDGTLLMQLRTEINPATCHAEAWWRKGIPCTVWPYVTVPQSGGVARLVAISPRAILSNPGIALVGERQSRVGWFPNKYFQLPVSALSAGSEFLLFADAHLAGEKKGQTTVTLISATADTIYTSSFPAFLRPIDVAERDSVFAEAIETQRKLQPNQSAMAASVAAAPRPEFWPPLRKALVARDGSAVIVFNTDGATRDYLLTGPTGRPVARFRLPAEVNAARFEGRTIWGIVRDRDDADSIVRYTIRP